MPQEGGSRYELSVLQTMLWIN